MADQTQLQPLKGFRDFLPKDAKNRAWLIAKMRKVYERFGFEPIETPTLEYKSTIMGKYGEEADKLVYQFVDNGDREVAMRYDQTVPTARFMVNYQNDLPLPFRRYQIQNVFRADKPQKGRYREFTQSDADIFGSTSELADAEILAVFYAIYKEIGLDVQISVNDRESLFAVVEGAGITKDKAFSVLQSLDKLDKQTESEVRAELAAKGFSTEQVDALFTQIAKSQPSEKLQKILMAAEKLGVQKTSMVFSPVLARGLDYYTGLIFEGRVSGYEVGSIGGGGRYDNLINQLSGVEMSAVGFGIGFDRTLEAAEQLGKTPSAATTTKVLVTVFNEQMTEESAIVAESLRSAGINTELYPIATNNLGKQLKYASKKGIPFVAIVGPEEKENSVVDLKNMSSGEQLKLSVDELTKKLIG